MPQKHVPKHRAPKRGSFGRLSMAGSKNGSRSSKNRPEPAPAEPRPAYSGPVSDEPLAPRPPAPVAESTAANPTPPKPAAPSPPPQRPKVSAPSGDLFAPEVATQPVRSSEEYFESLVNSQPVSPGGFTQPIVIKTPGEPAESLRPRVAASSESGSGLHAHSEHGSTMVEEPDTLRVKSAIKGGSEAWDPFLKDPEPEVRRFRRSPPISDLDRLKTRPKRKKKQKKRTHVAAPERQEHQSLGQWFREILILGLIAVLTAVMLTNYVVQAFFIPSESMQNTLVINDRVLVNKLVYKLRDPRPGDIVVFTSPERDQIEVPDHGPVGDVLNEAAQGLGLRSSVQDLIKRVVAVEGQTVEVRIGSLFVDGKQVDEPYRRDFLPMPNYGPYKVPPGTVFVLGDNRSQSHDSRSFGPVPESSIVGRAFALIWPLQRFDWLST